MQLPWSPLRSRCLVIKLQDVVLHVAPRDLSDWEMASASKRVQASKQAQLAAWELHRLSGKLTGDRSGSSHDGKRQSQSLASHLANMLLDRLQLSVDGASVCFEVWQGSQTLPQYLFSLILKMILLPSPRLAIKMMAFNAWTTPLNSLHLGS